jgi:hypothetical protein
VALPVVTAHNSLRPGTNRPSGCSPATIPQLVRSGGRSRRAADHNRLDSAAAGGSRRGRAGATAIARTFLRECGGSSAAQEARAASALVSSEAAAVATSGCGAAAADPPVHARRHGEGGAVGRDRAAGVAPRDQGAARDRARPACTSAGAAVPGRRRRGDQLSQRGARTQPRPGRGPGQRLARTGSGRLIRTPYASHLTRAPNCSRAQTRVDRAVGWPADRTWCASPGTDVPAWNLGPHHERAGGLAGIVGGGASGARAGGFLGVACLAGHVGGGERRRAAARSAPGQRLVEDGVRGERTGGGLFEARGVGPYEGAGLWRGFAGDTYA